ncbi:acetolactate synthase large subunit [Verrucomicrobiota bacterium sgz303538]
MKATGAEIIAKLIEREGVRVITGIPGGAILPLYDALARSENLRHILARHEQGAGFIAQGLARVTGRPQVCLATSGPGATNLLTAVADANLDSVPLVCFTGQVPQALIGTDAFQEVDIYGMSRPVTKHNFLVRSAEELLEVVPEAFRIAVSGRAGPVLIDVPKDVQLATAEFAEWPEPSRPDAPMRPTPEQIKRAAEMINRAQRPLLYIGGGVIAAEAAELVTRLAERGSIPATMTLMGLGAVPATHPLSVGMLGMHGSRGTNTVVSECDLLIAIGARFDDRVTGKVAEFCPDATVLHIDTDASEIGKIRAAQLGIACDARVALEELLPHIEPQPRIEWLARVKELRRMFPLRIPDAQDPSSAYGMILHVARLLGDNGIVTTDVGQHQMRVAQVYPFCRPRRWLTSGGLGTMGFGLPAAIGAALAEPDNTVVCFSGDGSLLMNVQEICTAVDHNLNVKIILQNNNALGLVHQQQDLFYGSQFSASHFASCPDFVRMAEAFGMKAYDLDLADDAGVMLEEALAEPGPTLVHASVDVCEKVFPMVPPGAANHQTLEKMPHALAT